MGLLKGGKIAAKSSRVASSVGGTVAKSAKLTKPLTKVTNISKNPISSAPSVPKTPPAARTYSPTQSKVTTSGGKTATGTDLGNNNNKPKTNLLSTDNLIKLQVAGSMLSGSGGQQKQRAGTVSASADLFDIVKGQLIDEGLSEEEIRDIMTTLTLDEINETLQLDEITGKLAMQASKAADMKRAQLAKAGDRAGAADKAAQASRLYKKGAERNLAKQDLSKPLNPQPTNYPKGKGASYQEKPGMSESLKDAYLKVYEGSGEGFGEKPEGSEEKPIEKKEKPKKERMTQQDRNFARKTFGAFNRKFGK